MHGGMSDVLVALGQLFEFGEQRSLAKVARYLYQEAENEDDHLHDGLEDAALTVAETCQYNIEDGWLTGDDHDAPNVPFDLDNVDVACLDDIYIQGVDAGYTAAVMAIRVHHDAHVHNRGEDDGRPDYYDGLVEAQRRVIAMFDVDDPNPGWGQADAS